MTSKKLQFKLSFYQLTYFLQWEFIPTQHNTPEDKYINTSIKYLLELVKTLAVNLTRKYSVHFMAKKETQVLEH